MPEYELRLRFTAADGSQASRLAEAWAGTCAAEYGTRYCGWRAVDEATTVTCEWCGRAIARSAHRGTWLAVKGTERGYDPSYCEANHDDAQYEPPSATATYEAFE